MILFHKYLKVHNFSQAYTPSTANCDLYIYCSAGIRERTNVADDVGMALFISDQTDALRVVTGFMQGYGHGEHLHLYHKMPISWGVSAKTLFHFDKSHQSKFCKLPSIIWWISIRKIFRRNQELYSLLKKFLLK